jgi:hypothetical protein
MDIPDRNLIPGTRIDADEIGRAIPIAASAYSIEQLAINSRRPTWSAIRPERRDPQTVPHKEEEMVKPKKSGERCN